MHFLVITMHFKTYFLEYLANLVVRLLLRVKNLLLFNYFQGKAARLRRAWGGHGFAI